MSIRTVRNNLKNSLFKTIDQEIAEWPIKGFMQLVEEKRQ